MNPILKTLSAAVLMTAAVASLAQSAGAWLVRSGATSISPKVSSGNLSSPSFAGTKTDVGGNTQLGGGLSYMLTDNVSLDLPLSLPFKHKLYGAGALAGAGELATVKALPMTLFGQYRFNDAQAAVRPYLGLGLTYAYFFDEAGNSTLTALTNPGASPTSLSVQSKMALSTQAGLTYRINDKWFLDAFVSKTFLKTSASFSTGQTIDMRLDPISYSLGIGYRF